MTLENQEAVIMSMRCIIAQSKDILKIMFALLVLGTEERNRLDYFFNLLISIGIIFLYIISLGVFY